MKELSVFLFIFMSPALSLDPTDSKVKRSLFPPGGGWNVQPTPPDFDSLTSWPGAENPWRTVRGPPDSLQSFQPSQGWGGLGAQQTAPPVVISKHTIIEKPVPRAVIVERRVPVQVDKYVPYPVDRIVNKPVPVAVPHPVPYPVDRPVQVPVRHTVAVPVPVTIRQRVPYPVPVPVIVTAHGLVPASSINLSGQQNGLNGVLSLPLPMLSPLAINAALGQGAPPEGLADSRDPGLAPPIEDNSLQRGQLQGDSIPWDSLQAGILNDSWAQASQIKWKRSPEEEKKEEKSSL